VDHGGADIGDDELGVWNEGIAEERKNSLHTAPGDEGQADIGAVAEESVEREPVGLSSAEEGSVEISCQKYNFG
jgi:hypothetical protein